MKEKSPATVAIHGGREPDPSTGAILTPIVQSTTYVCEAVGVHKGHTYSRASNPTVSVLEDALGELEGSLPAVCFGTGMAAIHALLFATVKAGDHVVCGDVVYGGTVRLLREFFTGYGVETSFVDTSVPQSVAAAMQRNTKLVIVETPANPTMKLTDVEAISAITKPYGALLAVDNTFMTPIGLRCFELGADITVYSTTKYIEGHDSTLGGALLTNDRALRERFFFTRKSVGSIQKAQEAWLTLRGLKTLPVRMKAHSDNAQQIAEWLASQDAVKTVFYPFLNHPKAGRLLTDGSLEDQLTLAKRTQKFGGGMLAFELRGGFVAGKHLMNSVKLCSLAENLGAVETLITHPVSMTHGDVPIAQREAAGITEGLVRLSVGLEDPQDLIADLAHALAGAEAAVG